jgi:hypothetical protein
MEYVMKDKYREIYEQNGFKDAVKGKWNYDPPNGVIHEAINSDAAEANTAYRRGHAKGVEEREHPKK